MAAGIEPAAPLRASGRDITRLSSDASPGRNSPQLLCGEETASGGQSDSFRKQPAPNFCLSGLRLTGA
jgi:hypothetical protein